MPETTTNYFKKVYAGYYNKLNIIIRLNLIIIILNKYY